MAGEWRIEGRTLSRKDEPMSLKADLKTLQTRLESNRPAEAVAVMHRAVDELRTSGAADRVLKVGDKPPDFILPDARGGAGPVEGPLRAGGRRP
jgi:hypothetical protein